MLFAFFPLSSQASDSLLRPLYHFLEYFNSEKPQPVTYWNVYQANTELNSAFYALFEQKNLTQAYLRKFTPPSRVIRLSNGSLEYPYDESSDAYLPAPAVLWLREKIGVCPRITIVDISLHVDDSLTLYDKGYHQPIWVTLQLNNHQIRLMINWQEDLLQVVPLDVLELWTIDGESFYDAISHDAEAMCVKCWFE